MRPRMALTLLVALVAASTLPAATAAAETPLVLAAGALRLHSLGTDC